MPHIIIAGGSGLIGTACGNLFRTAGYRVTTLTRRQTTGPGEVSWDPSRQWIEDNIIDGSAAVVNLCGMSLADRRWTKRYKRLLYSSRTEPALFVKKLIDNAAMPPLCYIGISGIGIYGDQGTQPVHDDVTLKAEGFVADLVRAWEQGHRQIHRSRNVILRTGVVLSAKGGFLGKVIPPARFGLYPYFGSGKQLLSWIDMDDLAQMMLYCITNESIQGIYHATAPCGIAQRDLMKILREVQRRPGILFGVPQILLRIGLGELASLLFESADVRPDKMLHSGFQFEYGDIRSALKHVLGAKAP